MPANCRIAPSLLAASFSAAGLWKTGILGHAKDHDSGRLFGGGTPYAGRTDLSFGSAMMGGGRG